MAFNIIFIPGTVYYQSIALLSLLSNTSFSFRLVGNALTSKEAQLLEDISRVSNRFSFVNFKSDEIIPHGTLVDLLFMHEKEPFFCFADSDVFIFKTLNKNITELINQADVFSTGSRLENKDSSKYAGFRGGATRISPDGNIPLATSFFCIYRRSSLQHIVDKYHVGFEQYRSKNEIPIKALKVINELKINFNMFDTGKLISVLFYYEKYKNSYVEIDDFYHLGGMSGRYLQKIKLENTQVFNDSSFLNDSVRAKIEGLNFRNDYETKLKKFYGSYFFTFLNSLVGNTKAPILNSKVKEISDTIACIEKKILHTLKIIKYDKAYLQIFNMISNYKPD